MAESRLSSIWNPDIKGQAMVISRVGSQERDGMLNAEVNGVDDDFLDLDSFANLDNLRGDRSLPIFAEFDVDVKGSLTPEPLLVEVLSRLDLFLFRILFLPMLMKRRCCYYDRPRRYCW